ncbi:Protein IFH1 [Yarrowia sp. B02]|nr:Protein IFH1 [Yarrowia sp. B02]
MARRKSSVHRPTYSGKRLEDVLQMKKTGRKAPVPARKAPVASKRYGRKALYQPDLSVEEEDDQDEELDSEDEAFETIIAAVNDEGSHDEASNDDTDSDEEDSDSSIDETSLPEAYRRRKFGAKSAKKSMLQNENESAIADSSEESDLSSLSDIETRLSSKDSTLVRRKSRRGSVVDHTLDEHVEFPRSKTEEGDSSDDSFEEDSLLKAIEADSSPNPDESDFDDEIGDLDEEEFENGDLDSPLSNNSYSSINDFSDEVDKDFDAINDNDIEREEEDAILQEIAENGDRLQTLSPTDDDESVASFGNYSRRNSHSQHHYTGYSSDEDEYSFEDNDPFFEPRDPNQVLITNGEVGMENNNTLNTTRTSSAPKGFTSDDDSYLFGYFFSDGSSSENEDKLGSSKRRPSLSTPKKPPAAGSSSSIFKNNQSGYSDYTVDSGDSTDEDTSLPPRTQKKCNTATEILSSSNIASRPPMLGSWVMTKERPFGIIDGLTTRSLSGQKSPPATNGKSNGFKYSTAIESDDCSDISDLNDIVLDEFIYTSDLDEEAPKDVSAESQPYSTSSNVPLSAFRNRGLVSNPLYQQRFTGTPIPSRRRPSHSREAIITPVRGLKKIKKKQFRKDLLMHKDYDGNDYDSGMVAEYSDGFNGFYGGL